MVKYRIVRVLLGLTGLLMLGGVGGATLNTAIEAAARPVAPQLLWPQVACTGPLSFPAAPNSPVPIGTRAQHVTTGDFTGDGRLDLATANFDSNNITVVLGDGTGRFQPAVGSPISLSFHPVDVTVTDVNDDGRADLAIVGYGDNLGGNTLMVMLGDGTGGFRTAPGSPLPFDNRPFTVTAGDFNGDGHRDLVSTNYSNNAVTLLLGDGTGNFHSALGSPFSVGVQPVNALAADFNGDGRSDLVIVNVGSSNVTVLLGTSQGGLSAAPDSPHALGSWPGNVTAGDFTGDGQLDLAVTTSGTGDVRVLLGDGTGRFHPAPGAPIPVGNGPGNVTAADFTGDGRLDLTTTNFNSTTVTILVGDGNGVFQPAPGAPFPIGIVPGSVVVGDFNGDGRPDLAATDVNSATLTALLTTCIATPALTATPAAPCPLPFRDVPADYYAYSAIQWAYCLGLSSGYGDGTFRPETPTTRGQVAKLIVGAAGWALSPGPGAPHFSDIAPGSIFYPYIEAAYAHGILGGYSDGTYRPSVPVTRSQLAKLIVLARGYALLTPPTPTFTDVPTASWAYPYIETAVAQHLVSGYTDHTFRPNTNATRAQFAKLLYQAYATPSKLHP